MAHLLIVEANYYADIAAAMYEGAVRAMNAAEASHERVQVPGALEIPAAIGFAEQAGHKGMLQRPFDGFVALGCVIRGETTHYDTVCMESARGLQLLSVNRGMAIGNGILTVENAEQAWARAKMDGKDKGGEAARACLAMVALKQRFGLLA